MTEIECKDMRLTERGVNIFRERMRKNTAIKEIGYPN